MAEYPSFSHSKPSRAPTRGTGWFYEIDGEEQGPVEFRSLRTLAISKKLLNHHLVWKEGSADKQAAADIVGLIPPSEDQASKPPQPNIGEKDPYATPESGSIADGPPGGLYLPHLSPSSFSLYLATFAIPAGIAYYCQQIQSQNSIIFLLALAGISLLFWLSLTVIYLHRAWEMMRMLGAHLTGTKAVRFLFFPFFNALWCFVVVYGWSRLWNHNVKNHPGLKPARSVWRPFFFLFPTLFLISQALLLMHILIREWPTDLQNYRHLISLGTWALTLLLTLATWSQICRSINFLARKKS